MCILAKFEVIRFVLPPPNNSKDTSGELNIKWPLVALASLPVISVIIYVQAVSCCHHYIGYLTLLSQRRKKYNSFQDNMQKISLLKLVPNCGNFSYLAFYLLSFNVFVHKNVVLCEILFWDPLHTYLTAQWIWKKSKGLSVQERRGPNASNNS